MLGFVLLLCSQVSAESVTESPPAIELTATESEMVTALNSFRSQSSLAALTPSASLMASARRHAQWMASNHSMTHAGGVQENIAAGQRSVSHAMTAWTNSSGHNANMRTSARYVGVGYAVSSNGTAYWCQQFGGPLATAARAVVHAPHAVYRRARWRR